MTIGAVNEYTDSVASWEIAREWFKSCTENPSFNKQFTELQLPSRLIDVGKEEGQARLCFGKDVPDDVQYLTLSHCWGPKRFTNLLYENLDTFWLGILKSVLSKTFKDAMKAIRELGFTYIWIDSLCISQDDDEDWSEQAPLMGSIYSNSVLNLLAVELANGDEGCFYRRVTRKLRSILLETESKGRAEAGVKVMDLLSLRLCGKAMVRSSPPGLGFVKGSKSRVGLQTLQIERKYARLKFKARATFPIKIDSRY